MLYLAALFLFSFGAASNDFSSLDGKIVGGHDSEIEDFPYQVSLRIYDEHFCGGSIIDAKTIVTAAHCVYGKYEAALAIRVGSKFHQNGTYYSLDGIYVHENYDKDTKNNDIALLKLMMPLKFTSNKSPVPLDSTNDHVGKTGLISGWGYEYENSNKSPDVLKSTDVEVIDDQTCKKRLGYRTFTNNMLCAASKGHDACQGDSGGPLVVDGQLVGITSWGIGCGEERYPGVYTRVANYVNWIKSKK